MKKYFIVIFLFVSSMIFLYFYLDQESLELNSKVRNEIGTDFVKVGDEFVHYKNIISEKKPFIILIHGYSAPMQTWKHQIKTLVDSGYSVLAYDLFGRGYSDRPNVRYSLDLFSQQIDRLLIALEIEAPVNLIGLSLGAHIAADYTMKNGQKVNKVILLNPQIKPLKNLLLELPLIGEFFMKVRVIPNLKTPREQKKYKGFSRALLSTTRELSGIDPIDKYLQISKTHQVAIIWGKEDKNTHFLYNYQNQLILYNTKHYFVEHAGHDAHNTNPEIVNSYIIKFLQID